MTFAQKVRQIINERGMTIADLSFDSRVQEATIRKILDENRNPRLDTAKKIADGLGVTLDSLVSLKEQSQSSGSLYQSPATPSPKLHGRAYHQG